MTLRLCFVLFVVPATLAAKLPNPAEVHDVFAGLPGYQASPGLVVTTPVTPVHNDSLVNPDYWDTNDDYQPPSVSYDDFDWAITKRIAASSDKNFILSPLGLKLTLTILTEGATGTTQAELIQVLNLDHNRTQIRSKFSTIIGSLECPSPTYEIALGSKIYIEANSQVTQKFATVSHDHYKTGVQTLNFGRPFEAAREINAWVSNVTRGKIHNLIREDDVAGSVLLVLSTLYFKGTWRHQFNPNATVEEKFYISPTAYKQVPFMNVKNSFFYAESTRYDAKILRMPYLGNKFSMFIVVPNSLTGLPRVMNSLAELRLDMKYLRERTVDVKMPKFNFDFTTKLNDVLNEMGIREAFEETASFPGIVRGLHQGELRISKVLQKSGVEVNELGSIGYSATVVSLVNKFGEDDDPAEEVIANKPFLFFIEDETTRQLLFIGRVSDPLADIAP